MKIIKSDETKKHVETSRGSRSFLHCPKAC